MAATCGDPSGNLQLLSPPKASVHRRYVPSAAILERFKFGPNIESHQSLKDRLKTSTSITQVYFISQCHIAQPPIYIQTTFSQSDQATEPPTPQESRRSSPGAQSFSCLVASNMKKFTPYSRESLALSFEMTSAQALNSVIDNMNNLISILRDPSDTATLLNSTLQADISSSNSQKVSLHISEAARALNKLAVDYNVTPTCLLSAPAYICAPQTANLVSSMGRLTMPKTEVVEPEVDSDCIDIGMAFESLKEAEEAFEDYAKRCGFNICKGNSKVNVYQEYACSSRGKVRVRKISDMTKHRNRKSIKKLCKCHIILRRKDNLWVITTRKLDHTHELMRQEEIKRTAKNRFIPDDVKEIAMKLYSQGEAPAKIQYMLETQMGDDCIWTMKDLYNMLYRHKLKEE